MFINCLKIYLYIYLSWAFCIVTILIIDIQLVVFCKFLKMLMRKLFSISVWSEAQPLKSIRSFHIAIKCYVWNWNLYFVYVRPITMKDFLGSVNIGSELVWFAVDESTTHCIDEVLVKLQRNQSMRLNVSPLKSLDIDIANVMTLQQTPLFSSRPRASFSFWLNRER